MSAQAVDVLAVMDARIASESRADGFAAVSACNELRETRVAVAELIEAARDVLADVDAPGHTVRNVRGESVAKVRAALARVGGAA